MTILILILLFVIIFSFIIAIKWSDSIQRRSIEACCLNLERRIISLESMSGMGSTRITGSIGIMGYTGFMGSTGMFMGHTGTTELIDSSGKRYTGFSLDKKNSEREKRKNISSKNKLTFITKKR